MNISEKEVFYICISFACGMILLLFRDKILHFINSEATDTQNEESSNSLFHVGLMFLFICIVVILRWLFGAE